MGLSDEAERLFQKIATRYVKQGYPGRRMVGYDPEDAEEANHLRELEANGLMEPKTLGGTYQFTDAGQLKAVGAAESGGQVHIGPSIVNTITNSTVGAFAVGGSTARGAVHTESMTFNQAQHEAMMKKAKAAMVEEESQLDPATNEALWKLLHLASKTKITVDQLAEQQRKLKESVDELWATTVVEGMKPQALSAALEVVKQLLANPLTATAVNGLLGAG